MVRKRIFGVVPGVLAALNAVIPILFLISVLAGKYFVVYSPLAWAIALSVLSIAAAVVFIVFKNGYRSVNGWVLSLLLPLTSAELFYFVYLALRIKPGSSLAPAAVMLFGLIAVIIMFVKSADDSIFRAACGVVTVIAGMAALAYAVYLSITVFAFREIKYSDGPDSPECTYSVEIKYTENGIMTDGETRVYVCKSKKTGAVIGCFEHKPGVIYSGGRLEYERIKVYWKDDETLVINGTEYPVDPASLPAVPAPESDGSDALTTESPDASFEEEGSLE
ncbi:MAG: hypothetical protein J5793_04735 [Clostridia bacterium]|nr:hypothetical protein [Clostridia bacterium]